MANLVQKEMTMEVQKIITDADGIIGSSIPKGKPYPEWMEQQPYPPGFKRPDLPSFNGKGTTRRHLCSSPLEQEGYFTWRHKRVYYSLVFWTG